MKTEVIPFTTKEAWLKERLKDVTSTEMAALFNISPYVTAFELWHTKKNQIVSEINENERMKWGTRLQESIAKGIGEDNGWAICPKTEYIRLTELKIGSSFDFAFCIPPETDLNILEIKNVDALAFKDGWLVDGEQVEAPPHIELQVQVELLVSGAKAAYIGALIGGNRVVLIKREPQLEIHEKIKKVVSEFWKSIEDGIEPQPDFKRDSEFIAKLYNKANKEDVAYSNEEIDKLAVDYHKACEIERDAKKVKEEIKARILMKIGLASRVEGENYTISSGEVKETKIKEYIRVSFRNFKITFKKEVKNV
jgi:putative phage-type endonuclease